MKLNGHSGEKRIAIVHLADNQGTHQCQQGVTWKYTPHASDPTQSGKTRLDDGSNMDPQCNSVIYGTVKKKAPAGTSAMLIKSY